MDLLQLRYFQTVAELQHMTRAAEKLRIAQPSLSLTIKKLEEDLGVLLFKRTGRNIELTAEGIVFLKYVNKAFDALELGKREMQQSLKNKNETITMSTSSIHFLTNLITLFINEYPHIKFSQTLDSNKIIKDHLLQKRIDCCITSPPIEDDAIETIEIANEEILLCVPNTHKFASAPSLCLKDLENEDFILLSEKYSFRQLINEWCSINNVSLNVLFECDFSLAFDLMNLKKGISLLPQSLCKKFVHSDIVFIHLTDANRFRKIGFSKLKDHHTVSVNLFQDFVIDYFKKHY